MTTQYYTQTLEFKWTVSRGRDTYGYNICTLLVDGSKAARCNGGGYDMQGTVLGDFVASAYTDRLNKLRKRVFNGHNINGEKVARLYGLTYHDPNFDFDSKPTDWSKCSNNWPTKKYTIPSIDGVCGMESVKEIMSKIGLYITFVSNSKNLSTFLIHDKKTLVKSYF